MRIFASLADHINKHQYAVLVPSHYNAITPVELSGEIAPMFEMHPSDIDRKVNSKQTIANLIAMVSTRTDFEIKEDKDLLEIMHTVEEYIYSMREEVKRNELIADYVYDCIQFRQAMYKAYYRAIHMNPGWLEAFSSANISEAHAILSMFSGTKTANTDGSGMLPRDPPYTIQKEKKVASTQQPPSIPPVTGFNPLMYGN